MTPTSSARIAPPAVITPPAANDSGDSQDSRTANAEPTSRYGQQTTFLNDPAPATEEEDKS